MTATSAVSAHCTATSPDGSVTATRSFLDGGGDDERESQSSSSPQSLEWSSFGRARGTSSAQDSSTTDASSLGSDDDRLPPHTLPTTLSTSSLKDALDLIAAGEDAAVREHDDASRLAAAPTGSHRPHLRPTHSEPPTLAVHSDRTPIAGFFHFATSEDAESAPTRVPPSIASTVRPALLHRKTHSGTPAGIHKRHASGSIRLVSQHRPSDPSSSTGWNTADIGALQSAGLRVHDFRPEPDALALVDDGPKTPTATALGPAPIRTSPVLVHRASISRRGSLGRVASGTRRARSGSVAKAALLAAPTQTLKRSAVGLAGPELLEKLEQAERGTSKHPLVVVDVRSLSAFLGDAGRIRSSINVNFPSLLIKRFKKGNTSNFSLGAFITTEAGKAHFRQLAPSGSLDGLDVVVVDQRPESRDPASTSAGAVLISVLERRDEQGEIFFLSQPFAALLGSSRWRPWIVSGEHELDDVGPTGLLTLQPSALSTALLPHLSTSSPSRETDGWHSSTPPFSTDVPPPSPMTPGGTRRPRPPKLRRIDTSDDLLATARTGPPRPADPRSLTPPPRPTVRPSRSRADLRIDAAAASHLPPSSMSIQALCHVQSKSPAATATRFREADLEPPRTARPAASPDTPSAAGSAECAPWVVSTIIPGFLYLGPEPTRKEDLDDLERRGVRQILNLALECDDRDGEMGRRFERYWRIPMRDFVEETGVQRSIEEACKILSDAQLQSKPIYCHCRAGKSRSVTIVLAYLVHRNNWSLKRAYAHVSERRKGISPNIGFVAELMKWEERERGGKSHGVFGSLPTSPPVAHAATASAAYFPSDPEEDSASGRIRPGRIRDSMPPPLDAGTQGEREMEVRAEDGSWVPARRDPRDKNSNPLRRASRAGLESIVGGATSWGD